MNSVTLQTSNGTEFIIDASDYELVSKYRWQIQTPGKYVRSNYKHGKCIYIHRLLTNPESGLHVDHINGNKLDNRRENLRVCTQAQNNLNVKKRENCSSRYKGVYKSSSRINKWKVQIVLRGKFHHVGLFADEIEAAKAYNKKAKELFGEYARLNDVEDVAI